MQQGADAALSQPIQSLGLIECRISRIDLFQYIRVKLKKRDGKPEDLGSMFVCLIVMADQFCQGLKGLCLLYEYQGVFNQLLRPLDGGGAHCAQSV